MSLSNGHADHSVSTPATSSTTRAVMLLAFAVLLGVGLLHELDNGSTVMNAKSASSTGSPDTTIAAVASTSTTAVARTPAQVSVLVANGTGASGVAATMSQRLTPSGYRMLTPGNTTARFTTSQVQYTTGYQTEAEQIAAVYQIPAVSVVPLSAPAPVADLAGANVVVVIGEDLAAAAGGSRTASTAPSGPLSSTTQPSTTVAGATAGATQGGASGAVGNATPTSALATTTTSTVAAR